MPDDSAITKASGPDADHMTRWCRDLLPSLLVEVCQCADAEAVAIGEDVLARATAFSRLPDKTREVLVAPFLEEVFDHEPYPVSLSLLGATAVVVRNSKLEDAHVEGKVDTGGLRAFTTAAAAPLSHLLGAARRHPIDLVGDDPFEGLDVRYPRAWACLEVLAEVVESDSGRQAYRTTTSDGLPTLPRNEEIVPSQVARTASGGMVFSGINPRFDQELINQLSVAVRDQEPSVLFVSALSRLSRNSDKQLRIIDLLLAHNVTILTTNYLLRPHDVWVRRQLLVKPNSRTPLDGLRRRQGLSGTHRQVVTELLATGGLA
ncbi:hypothetical protein [Umezawaea sp. NPDC059074]|uniref:hypothetical protein n=1 Tax=Umezawaea sp. NPDC059074 TaxID=3346716 RepID=UPI0036943852